MERENTDSITDYEYYLKGCAKLGWSNPLSPMEFNSKYAIYQRYLPIVQQASEEIRQLQGNGFWDSLQALFDSVRFQEQEKARQQWRQVSFIGSAVAAGRNDDEGAAGAGVGVRPVPAPPSRSGTAVQAIPDSEFS